MADLRERKTTRREPISITAELANGDEHKFDAKPLPWRVRNDLGEAINAMYANALNLEIRALTDDDGNVTGLQGSMFEKVMDYPGLFIFAFSEWEIDDAGEAKAKKPPSKADTAAFNQIDFDQMIEVLVAALDVNGLDRLVHLLDPERKKAPLTGASEPQTETPTDDGMKTE